MIRKDAQAGTRSSRFNWRKWRWAFGGLAVVIACVVVRYSWGPDSASAKDPQPVKRASAQAPAAPAADQPSAIVAAVNGQQIPRSELAAECLRIFGEEVLEGMVNKYLIAQHCRELNIVVTQGEVNEEVGRVAGRFGLSVDSWYSMLKKERGISSAQYADDIIWPMLALRKLAAKELAPTQQELQQAFESEFGPAVQARMIVIEDPAKAREAHAKAKANPDDFPNLAKAYSTDINIASSKGLFPPIRRHVGEKQIEEAAFTLPKGAISNVIQVGNQYVILKCEEHIPAREIPAETRKSVQERHAEAIRDRKLRTAASELFKQLQEKARVENVYNDPAKRKAQPGVAALINGQAIPLADLAEACVERHGVEVLEGVISRRLLEQTLKQRSIAVTPDDLGHEVARAAHSMGKVTPDGKPDVEGWLAAITEQQGVTVDTYMRDAVWPSVALKKLAGNSVKVSDDDLVKGYEANYGPRVRCRAIVLPSQRLAQQVWGEARDNPTAEHFARLAEEYSIEPGSRSLGGKVPPIQKHGGQPNLEKEAFSLQPGELSGVVQVNDKFIILLCEGYTEPTKVEFAEVRDLIYEDVHEKKLRVAMAQEFERIKEAARIDNFLAGTSHSPSKGGSPVSDNAVMPAGGRTPALMPGDPRGGAVKPAAGRAGANMASPQGVNRTPPPR